ncbi:tetratricopeptide repeat protein [Planctomycetales bacterium ZRK34]|nr:tetratricopeptide repeat protein [Planctomycetales bacterium ZRK34]
MTLRTKTKKRISILLGCIVVAVVLIVILGTYQKNKAQARLQQNLEQGMAAAEAGDYAEALEKLGKYWNSERNNPEADAVYQFGMARLNVEMPNNKHIGGAMALFENVLEIDPNYEPAMRKVLEIRLLANMNLETVEMADRILALKPDDPEALNAKTIALVRLRKLDEALAVGLKAAEVSPEDLKVQTTVLAIMMRLEKPNEEILDYAAKLREKYSDNPRFEILQAYAYTLTNDRPKGMELIKTAAQHDPPDAEFVQLIADQLAGMGQFADSMKYLDEHVKQFDDNNLRRMYCRRLWQANRYEDLATELKDIDPANAEAPSDLLVLKAMALIREKKPDEATVIIDALAERTGDNTAHAWVPVLRDVFAQKPQEIQQVIKICRDSIATLPGDPYLRMFLAESYAQLGENELALEQWENVTKLAPTWAVPYIRIASVYTSTKRTRPALQAAQQGLLRAPNNVGAVVSVANAWAALIDSGEGDAGAEQFMTLLEQIQTASPGEPNTLPLYIDMLARTGKKDTARTKLSAALADEKVTLPEPVMLRLAKISAEYDLGLADSIYAHAEQSEGGLNANLAYSRAMQIAEAQGTAAAIKYIQPLVEKNGPSNLAWQLAWARFLDRTRDERAAAAWIALGDKYPDNLRLQRMVLDAKSVQSDRDFMDRTIERVKALSGDEGLTWQLARAKWLLSGDGGTRDASKAVQILNEIIRSSPDLMEPHLLLAAALQKLDNTAGAIDQLTTAGSMQPSNQSIQLELARLYTFQGNVTEARDILNQILLDKELSDVQQAQAAALLARLGDAQRAIDILESSKKPSTLLAELYVRQSRLEDAEKLYQLMMQEHPNPQVVQAYSNLLGATGRADEGLNVLAQLKTMDLKPGVLEMLQGEYYRRYFSTDKALESFEAAAKAMPDNPLPWRTLIDIHLQAGEFDQAMKVNEQAKAAIPGDKVFSLIDSQRDLIEVALKTERLKPLARAVVLDENNRDAAIVVLRTIKEASDQSQSMLKVVLSLGKLADKHPRFQALQILLVDTYSLIGRYEDAIDLATRLMESFPNDADPAERAARLLARVGRWNEVVAVARQWRQRSLNQPLEADMMIAQALLQLGNPQQALEQISRYEQIAAKNPTRLPGVMALQAEGLIAMNQVDKAANILKPLIPTHPRWRALWMQLAMRNIKDPAVSAEWLERADKVIPADSISERVNLANYWFALGQSASNSDFRNRGVELLKSMAYAEKPDADAVVAYAIVVYQLGDLNQAEKEYRRALTINPDHVTAKNNLAILVSDRGGNLDEALKLAQEVVDARPRVATFHDTLAHVYLARKDFGKAAESLLEAVKLQPESIEWKVNLTEALTGKGDVDAAKQVLGEIDTLAPDPDQMPVNLRERLDKIRQTLIEGPVATPAP